MKDLLAEVRASVFMEYERATKKFGPVNNSAHESHSIIWEEFEEAADAGGIFERSFERVWDEIKKNRVTEESFSLLFQYACEAAAEWIQVAAMCYKAERSIANDK